MTGWGIVSMVASFALLALGAMVSLRKPVQYELMDETKERSLDFRWSLGTDTLRRVSG